MKSYSQGYCELLVRLGEIDSEAVEWLEDPANATLVEKQGSGQLLGTIIFDSTPQGFSYWENLAYQLGELGESAE